MDFKSGKKSIGGLFSCKKQFIIPRFQREYTWEKVELNEFLDDILSRIKVVDGKLDTSEYFWGSLLFVGDLDDQKNMEVLVVDGQQRITTMTIFLSVIAKMFKKGHNDKLAEALWEYIIGKNANTEEFAILKNETPKPFFQFTVQTLKENNIEPKNNEEEKILKANKFFKNNLTKASLIKRLIRLNKNDVTKFDYLELLKIIRDQLLQGFVICISTTDNEYANMIFEILNAKGKELVSIDLIKNTIFEKLTSEVPADTAKEKWLNIRNNLCSRNLRVEFASFYRHFWTAHYGKVPDTKLYGDFQKKIAKTEQSYIGFLSEMESASQLYAMILKPNLDSDFKNKKEYNFLITELNAINNVYGLVQARPAFLSLLHLHHDTNILTLKILKKVVVGMSAFHLAYTAICSKRASKLESPLNTLAYTLYHSTTNADVINALQEYKKALISLYPTEEEFVENFCKLKYSKSPLPTNMLAKFIVNKWEAYISNSDVFEADGSVEHILDENQDNEKSLLMGNLLLIERQINSMIPHGLNLKDKIDYYKNSKYKIIKDFIEMPALSATWNSNEIDERSKQWSKEYYERLKSIINAII